MNVHVWQGKIVDVDCRWEPNKGQFFLPPPFFWYRYNRTLQQQPFPNLFSFYSSSGWLEFTSWDYQHIAKSAFNLIVDQNVPSRLHWTQSMFFENPIEELVLRRSHDRRIIRSDTEYQICTIEGN